MERTCMNFFKFFVNFVSSCAQYVHGESMCTGYVPLFYYAFLTYQGIGLWTGLGAVRWE
jgi:hypothetical protein